MRDLIREFKMLTKRRDEFSDTESQPLLSSHSSSSSFGATLNSCMFPDYDTTDCDECERGVTTVDLSPNNLPQIYSGRPLCVPRRSVYDTPALDVYTAEEEIYDRWPYFSKVSGVLARRASSLIQKSFSESGHQDIDRDKTQSSLVTIFAIWNTTMGSSLLAMPWGIERAGLIPGIIINILVASICLYTCYILLKVNDGYGLLGQNNQVSDLCRMLIGRWAETMARIFSMVVLLGSNIVYWVLMSNFLYYSVYFLFGYLTYKIETPSNNTVICPRDTILNTTAINIAVTKDEYHIFDIAWDLHRTVPVILALIMFPLLNFKSPTFFTKFNSLGTICAMFLFGFVVTKAVSWGINISDWSEEFNLKSSFCALSGMLSLSYFIHNIIISIMKNNQYQEKNGRDLTIAFCLVTFTYIFIGTSVYVSFPLPKLCLEDNILNNFEKYDTMTIITRMLLLFQLLTVFPLVSYMLRMDIFRNLSMIFNNCSEEFTYCKVIMVNIGIVTVCISFACFFPKIGTLIRYTGALSGLVYIFLIPSLLKLASLKKEQALTIWKLIFYVGIIAFGFINVIAQFFTNDK